MTFTHGLGILMPRVLETVNAHPQRAVALHVMHPQRPGNKFSPHLAADILLDAVR